MAYGLRVTGFPPMKVKSKRDDSQHGDVEIDMPAGKQSVHPILLSVFVFCRRLMYSQQLQKHHGDGQIDTHHSAHS